MESKMWMVIIMNKEKVTCVDCDYSYERDTEFLKNRYSNIDIPVQIAIIKTSKCPECSSMNCKVQFIQEKENIQEQVG